MASQDINGRRLSEHEREIKKWEEKIAEREKKLEAKELELKKKEEELLQESEKSKDDLESLDKRLAKLRQRERELTEQEDEELTRQRQKLSEIQAMKSACINERLKIEAIQEQIANDEVPNHDSAFSSRETTASPPINRVRNFIVKTQWRNLRIANNHKIIYEANVS